MPYTTEFANGSARTATIWERYGALMMLPPGEKKAIESGDEHTLYAEYSRVEVRPNGMLILTPRIGWNEPVVPPGHVRLLLQNVDGKEAEIRTIEGYGEVFIPKWVPVSVVVPIDSPKAVYSEMRIMRVKRWATDPHWPGYATTVERMEDVWLDRDPEEIRRAEEQKAEIDAETERRRAELEAEVDAKMGKANAA